MTTTQKEILNELYREIKMREKVWRGIKTSQGVKFTDMKRQKQFDLIVFTGALIEVITPAEFQTFYDRIERRVREKDAQQELF